MKYESLSDHIIAVLNRRGPMTRTDLLPLLRHNARAAEIHEALDALIGKGLVSPTEREVTITRKRMVQAVELNKDHPALRRLRDKAHNANIEDMILS